MGFRCSNVKPNQRSRRLGDHREDARAEIIRVIALGFAGRAEIVAVPKEPLTSLLAQLLALMRSRYVGDAVHRILHRPVEHGAPELSLGRVMLLAAALLVCCYLHGIL